jgi:hypothetical protein
MFFEAFKQLSHRSVDFIIAVFTGGARILVGMGGWEVSAPDFSNLPGLHIFSIFTNVFTRRVVQDN